jgi:chemotaxis family two-component system response regulator Rcp1
MEEELRECTILYVEDDDSTAYLFQHALQQTGTDVRLFRLSDGEKGTAFLHRQGIYADAPLPDLVILDIDLPQMSGFDVLAEMQMAEGLKGVPTVMFSSSSRAADRQRALDLGAREYFVKPSEWQSFLDTCKSICDLAHRGRKRKHRATDLATSHIDYCLHILGIRVWSTQCQLIGKIENHWHPFGPARDLPIILPASGDALASAGLDTLFLTAWQYEREHTGTDIREVLSQKIPFDVALSTHH